MTKEGSLADDAKLKEKTSNEPEVRRLSMFPLLKQRSSSTRSSIADLDLVELSLLDVLTQTATDVLGSIPAQRCIAYIYDKAANLLRPQIVVDCSDKVPEKGSTQPQDKPCVSISQVLSPVTEKPGTMSNSSSVVDILSEQVLKSPLVSFPPVVGMVSSCFLQKRCLRMQEPHPHRAFHREYDVPKDMQVDSILCAPVILYHRATAVIQLLNRLGTTADGIPFEKIERPATPHDTKNDSSTEVRLRRLKPVKAMEKTGFSTKDEQKLLHFAMHIAHTIEINTKKLANVRNHAKIREDKAKQALDLLNSLNSNIVVRDNSTEMLLPANVAEHTDHSVHMRRTTIMRMPPQIGGLTNMLAALVVITRLQAMFRGRRQRRADKFAEELEKFRRQRERMKTVIVMQRIVRTPEKPKPKVNVKPAINRPNESSPRSKNRVEDLKKPQSRIKSPPTTPSTPRRSPRQPVAPSPPRRSPRQPVAPSPPRPQTQPKQSHKRRMSATKIQKVFRRYRQRRQAITSSTAGKPIDVFKEVASAVKVQSFIRGNLVRKKLRHTLLSPCSPRIVCLRVASASPETVSSQNNHESPRSTQLRSQICVYAMPERPGKAPPTHRRYSLSVHNQEELYGESNNERRSDVAVESRRLFAIHKGDDTPRLKPPSRRSKPRWGRLVSSVVWETSQHFEHELAPPGVEFVKQRRPNAHYPKVDKVNSPRFASIMSVSEQSKNQKDGDSVKPSVRLPALGLHKPREVVKSSLMCCLLPVQPKILPDDIAPIAPTVKVKHRSPLATSGD